jgi:regulator of sigma E protease
MEARWAPPDIVHTVEPGDTTNSVAALLGVPRESVLQAADIDVGLSEGRELMITDGDETVTYEVQSGDTLAAGLPDPEVLTPGEELRIIQGPTGITIATWNPAFVESESFPIWEAIPEGTSEYLETLVLFRNEVFSWFKGGSSPGFAGPVGIAQATGEVVEQSGWIALLELAALLSFNLGVINILPLPMLDGGRIVFVLLEIVRRGRRIAPEKEALVHLVGLALILTAALAMTYFDVVRVIRGDSLFR